MLAGIIDNSIILLFKDSKLNFRIKLIKLILELKEIRKTNAILFTINFYNQFYNIDVTISCIDMSIALTQIL